MIASFNRFQIELPPQAVADCSHSGACDSDVAFWLPKLPQIAAIDPEKLRAELKEYGAWDAEELADHGANCARILWIAAGNIKEESRA